MAPAAAVQPFWVLHCRQQVHPRRSPNLARHGRRSPPEQDHALACSPQAPEPPLPLTLNSTVRMPPRTRKVSPCSTEGPNDTRVAEKTKHTGRVEVHTTASLPQSCCTPPSTRPNSAAIARCGGGHAPEVTAAHLAHGAVRLLEVWLQEGVKQVARDALDCVLKRQHVDALAVLDVGALVHRHNVAQPHAQVLAHHLEWGVWVGATLLGICARAGSQAASAAARLYAQAHAASELGQLLHSGWQQVLGHTSNTAQQPAPTLFMRILASSTVSSASTMHTVSLRFLPCSGVRVGRGSGN